MVALLKCTAIFVWYMAMPVVKMDTKITRVMMRLEDYAQNVDTILGFLLNTLGGPIQSLVVEEKFQFELLGLLHLNPNSEM